MKKPAGDLSGIGLFVSRHRRNLVVRKFAGLCRRYLSWYGNVSYNFRTNGEAHVLDVLGGFQPNLLIDAGANVGGWTHEARLRCPSAEIHAFEIAQPTFEKLVASTRHLPKVRCLNLGLSDVPGSVRIRHYAEFPALTTSSDYPHPFAFDELTAEVTTGDSYAAREGIQRIDMLKIDVEGMEEPVLRGFGEMLRRKAIDLVQFEYGRVSIVHHFLLRDFYNFFNERGYIVGKIYPGYVDFREYDMGDEDFMGPNYLACSSDREDYRLALGGARR